MQSLWNRAANSNYQSPSLSGVPPDFESFFPCVVRRHSFNPWVRHTGRYDRRYPGVGLVTHDETAILFNYGLALQHESIIEIGCWVGWSTTAWALSGVHVIAIDPVLNRLPQGESCRASLQKAGMLDNVDLIGDYSHEALARLAASGFHARGIFIDGDHEGDAPLHDAMDAQAVAADDCIIIFHDLLQPNIGRALTWLGRHGWNCGIHYTAQFVGVAWRGGLRPLHCQPDPKVEWTTLIRKRYPHLVEFPSLE